MTKIKPTSEPNGFSYHVSDEQLAVFAKLSDLERLQWVDDAKFFTYNDANV
jgi:hypothetical protein